MLAAILVLETNAITHFQSVVMLVSCNCFIGQPCLFGVAVYVSGWTILQLSTLP